MQELWGKFCEKLGTFLERARSPKGSVSVNYKVNYWLITRFGRAGRRCGYGMVPEVYGVARLQRLGLTIRAVSYTHLDVYKRQSIMRLPGDDKRTGSVGERLTMGPGRSFLLVDPEFGSGSA